MLYIKTVPQELFPWDENTYMLGVSISSADRANGSPKKGDMIAINSSNCTDMWLVSKDFFEKNYTRAVNLKLY